LEEKESDLLYAKQVEQLYALAPVGIMASVVNGPMLVFVQWTVISHGVLFTWLSALLLMNGLWIFLCDQFRKAPRNLLDSHRWGSRFLWGTFASGVIWGIAGLVAFPESSIPHKVFIAFVLGGMIAGGTAVYAALQEALLAFTVPAVTPLLVRFFVPGDELHMAIGSMSLLFVALMLVTVRRNHTVTVASMSLSLELMKSNQSLHNEIGERTQAEVALRDSREQLFSVVQSTDEGIISLNGQVAFFSSFL
jgi:hypothetical protein